MLASQPRRPEAVDPTQVSPSGPWRSVKQLGLVLLCVFWIGLGLTGHDPWKTEDAVTFGLALDVATRGDVAEPRLVGEPRLDHGPLVPALAAVTLKLASPPLEAPDAARLAAGVLLAGILAFTSLASRELAGRAFRWMPVLVLVGSVGLWDRAHVLSVDLGATLGVAIALLGFGLAPRRPLVGGVVIGIGAAVGFLSNGLAVPLWLVATSLLLPLTGKAWRSREFAATFVVWIVVAALAGATWLASLYMRDPQGLAEWRAVETANRYFAWLGSPDDFDPGFTFKNLLWFAWPAVPLVIWTLWIRARGFNGGMRDDAVRVPLVMALVILVAGSIHADASLINLMPLLVPLAILASLEIDSLKRGFSGALDWFGILTFGLLATLVWVVWVDAYMHGMSAQVATLFRDTEAGYRPSFRLVPVLVAVFLTLLWVALVRPARKSNRRALLNWAAGVVLVWGLYSTIWLPYLDSRRSYRWVVETLHEQLPSGGCVIGRNLGDAQRALLHYFAGITTVRDDAPGAADCPALIVQSNRQAPADVPGWTRRWSGGRRGDNTESFALYTRGTP
ncbi:MAG: hypothetical protein JSR18_02225 [Proteobacteria bacterium]|nr:hypothetical protein [Pseudomonadota bacterium]